MRSQFMEAKKSFGNSNQFRMLQHPFVRGITKNTLEECVMEMRKHSFDVDNRSSQLNDEIRIGLNWMLEMYSIYLKDSFNLKFLL